MGAEIAWEVRDAVGWICLEGADRLNAIGTKTYGGLGAAMRDLENRPEVRAVVVHGAGRVFSAGADIEEMRGFSGPREFEAFIHGFTDTLDIIASSRLPVIAAIQGAALGGGLELALACDIRIATPDSKLGLPEAKLGVLPGAGGTQRLPRLVPQGVAKEMLMLGNSISGRRGYQLGLVNRLCDGEELLGTAGDFAQRLTAGSAQVPAAAKSLLHATTGLSLAEGIERERAVVSDLFGTDDGREGFAAFVEKRSPKFGGE